MHRHLLKKAVKTALSMQENNVLFVPIPVMDDADYNKLVDDMLTRIETLEKLQKNLKSVEM